MFNTFYNFKYQIELERAKSIENVLSRMYAYSGERVQHLSTIKETSKEIISEIDWYRGSDIHCIREKIIELITQYDRDRKLSIDEDLISSTVRRIKDIVMISENDFLKALLSDRLNTEFNDQVCNIFLENSGVIELQVKDKKISVSIEEVGEVSFSNPSNLSFHTEALYLDDPFILDNLRESYRRPFYHDHRYYTQAKLIRERAETNVFDEIIVKDKLSRIYKKISSICDGSIVLNKRYSPGYQKSRDDKVLNVRNLSTGLKTFAIMKTLLMNGSIEAGGVLILDEPEIHLHPEWQLLFAELIVLLQKEFYIHVLLNTHSPYFLNAIEVYAAKYDVDDRCKYYLSSSRGEVSEIEDVTENIEKIYEKLARPLQDLENERGRMM